MDLNYLNNTIILCNDKNRYYFDKLEKNIKIFNYYKTKNIFFYFIKLLYKILKVESIYFLLFNKNWKTIIKEYKYVILLDDQYNKHIGNYIRKKNINCKIALYYLNNVQEYNIVHFDDKNINEIFLINEDDAIKYNKQFLCSFYVKYSPKIEKKMEYDVIYVGRDKGRKKACEKIKYLFENNGLKTYFLIINKEKEYITYDNYIKKVLQSQAILEYVSSANFGLTFRCMEALQHNKKLITNNMKVKNYDFYNPNNIFIYNENSININEIINFMKLDFILISEEIKNKYVFEERIEKICKLLDNSY